MPSDKDFMHFMAMWMLVHETADEGLKASVERGHDPGSSPMNASSDAFVNGLAAQIAEEKEALKARLSSAAEPDSDPERDVVHLLSELRFEVAELRGRIESLQSSVDAIARRAG